MVSKVDDASLTNVDPDDDEALFRRSVADTRPLGSTARAPQSRRAAPRARFRRADEEAVLRESLTADIDTAESMNGDRLRFCRPVVGKRVFRKLARGGYSVQDEIDLHGMSSAEAARALREFIAESVERGLSCVRVVHGKGRGSGQRGPVLKRKADALLRRFDAVLAFVSTRQVDGGSGAVYVLLRRS